MATFRPGTWHTSDEFWIGTDTHNDMKWHVGDGRYPAYKEMPVPPAPTITLNYDASIDEDIDRQVYQLLLEAPDKGLTATQISDTIHKGSLTTILKVTVSLNRMVIRGIVQQVEINEYPFRYILI